MRANNGAQMTPTLILTRPRAQSQAFAADLRAASKAPLDVIIAPLLEIVPLKPAAVTSDAVIFTSANGVRAAQDLDLPPGLTAWCVGAKTQALAAEQGFHALAGPGDAAGLVAHIISAQPRGTLAHIRGTHTRGDVVGQLNAAGLAAVDVVAYDQRAKELTAQARAALCDTKQIIFPLFSPRTGTILNKHKGIVAPVHIIALSDAVKQAIDPDRGWDVTVTPSPDGAAMLATVLACLGQAKPIA